MNPKIQLAYDLLWIGHPVLESLVAVVMVRRKLHRTFPVFFAYLLAQITFFLVEFPTHKFLSYYTFFYTHWIGEAIMVIIGFKVIHEIFLDVFRPYHTLKDLGSVLFKWAGLVMLLVAGVVAAASNSTEQGPLVQAVLTVQRCVRVTQVGLILFLLVFSRYLGVSWKQHSFGLAMGFGIFASVELMLIAFRASGYISENNGSIVNMAAYNCVIITWGAYATMKGIARDTSAALLMSQRWDQSLGDLQHPAKPDSLIPMFEGMVDRAFSRTRDDLYLNDDLTLPADLPEPSKTSVLRLAETPLPPEPAAPDSPRPPLRRAASADSSLVK
jgi:hypothetical protein